MKILVTGSAGFIGSHLYQKLTQMGHEVVGIDNFFHASKNPNNVNVLRLDIREHLDKFIQWSDIVYLLAACIHVDYSIEKPVETFDINVNGTINVLETCRKYGKKLVFASSSEIYGSSQTDFMSESHPLDAQSPYAVTKIAGDKICTVYKDVYGMKVDVIRNFNTFGPWQNDTSYGGVIAKFTKAALNGTDLQIYGDGTQSRDYMYIDDALQGYLMSLENDLDKPTNFGTGQTVTVNELAEMIVRLAHSQSKIVHVSPRAGEVQRLCADISLAKSLGFKPNTDFERDLGRYVNWYKEEVWKNDS
jgi:UDP-glucose 4-epimerase